MVPRRVLVVDDHPDIRSILGRLLPKAGIKIAGEAGTGEEALAWCATNDVDIVVMDAQMPGIGGVEATSEIRRMHPHVTVFGFTAWAETETAPLLEAGAAAVFEKTDVGGLMAALERFVNEGPA